MGYTTTFDGTIELSRTLTFKEVNALADNADERHDPAVAPGYHCDFQANQDGTGLVWNGTEKTYDAVEWIQYICDRFLRPWSVVASGELVAAGQRAGDVWKLVVKANQVSSVAGRFVFEEE